METNVPEILKSRRFWSALLGVVFMVLVNIIPELKANAEQLTNAALIVIGLLVGGYSLEDAVTANAAKK